MVELINIQLDEGFFKETEEYGFRVTRQRKELWAIELDLLAELDKVCKKHGLHWQVASGTLLGTVRHQGFIPWDDDIDVYLLREDYDRLMKLHNEFIRPFFLQNSETEEYLLRKHAKLMRTDTTACVKNEAFMPIQKGIFIDIFPLDGVRNQGDDYLQKMKDFALRKLYNGFCDMNKQNTDIPLERRIRKKLEKAFYRIVDKRLIYNAYENNLKKYSAQGTEIWGNRALFFECKKDRRPISEWVNTIELPFEMMRVPAPSNYDSMLRQEYGDYMQIPNKKGQSIHGELIVSTEFSFDDPRREYNILS